MHGDHQSHGNHPMSLVAYILVLAGFGSAAMWLVTMGSGYVAQAVTLAIVTFGCFATAATILRSIAVKTHHSPVLPDNSEYDIVRYRKLYRGA